MSGYGTSCAAAQRQRSGCGSTAWGCDCDSWVGRVIWLGSDVYKNEPSRQARGAWTDGQCFRTGNLRVSHTQYGEILRASHTAIAVIATREEEDEQGFLVALSFNGRTMITGYHHS